MLSPVKVNRLNGNCLALANFACMSAAPDHKDLPIGFAPPFIDEATIKAVERVLRSGWITSGPETAAFEGELAAFLGVDHVVCGGSWTGLAGVILDWFGVGAGDEVILPAFTYCATANVVLHRGATPVFIDLPEKADRDGSNILWKAVADRLSPRTKVVMPVDIGGWPVLHGDWKAALEAWSGKNGFQAVGPIQAKLGRPLLLADAAHSFGAQIDGLPVGSQADISVFSFHAVKNLTTAEGGAAGLSLPKEFDQDEVRATLKSSCLHGQTKDAAAKFHSSGKGAWKYDVAAPGFKCNMTDIQAAMGRVALNRYGGDLEHRHSLADAYDQGLRDISEVQLPQRQCARRKSADHLYAIQLNDACAPHRDQVMEILAEEGISTNVHFPPVPTLSAYRERGFNPSTVPNALEVFGRSVSLPIHRNMSVRDVHRVCRVLRTALTQVQEAAGK